MPIIKVLTLRCHDTQHNDTKCNGTQPKDIQPIDPQHNVMLFVLSVIILSVVMLNVVAPFYYPHPQPKKTFLRSSNFVAIN